MEQPTLTYNLVDRLWLASLFFFPFCIGAFFVVYGFREMQTLGWLVNHGETADGHVVSVETTDDGSGPYYRPTVKFTDVHGQPREVIARYDLDEVVVGSTIRVYYDPADRERVVIEDDTGTGRLVACIVFGILLAVFTSVTTGPVLTIFRIPLRAQTRD